MSAETNRFSVPSKVVFGMQSKNFVCQNIFKCLKLNRPGLRSLSIVFLGDLATVMQTKENAI